MDQDREIRLRLTAVADIGDAKQRLLELLEIQNQLIATNERQRAASRQKALDSLAEGSREKGLIESLIAKQKELAEAKKQATTLGELRRYNEELTRTETKLRQLEGATNAHAAAVHRQVGGFRSLGAVIGATLSTAAILQFGKSLLAAGSNAESFGLTLQTLLGNKAKADQVAAQAVELAKKTPFTLQQVQEQIVGLSAYNIEAEKLIPTITMLGNISAAVGTEKLPQLTLAYGQVRGANKLTSAELRQFTEAGVDLLGFLAAQSGKSLGEVRQDMAKSKVSFADVEKALNSTSAAGGKFFNLMQARSGTVGGLVSNFLDGMYQGYVRIEKQYDQTTKSVIRWGTETVDAHFGSESAVRRSIEAVKVLFAAWVTYRAIMIANTVQTRLATAETLNLVGTQRLLFVATNNANLATKGLFATLRANPVGLLTAAVGLLFTAYQTWKTSQVEVNTALSESEVKLRVERRELVATVAEAKRYEVGTKQRAAQIRILQEKYPDFLRNLDAEKVSNAELNKRLYEVNLQYKERIKLASLAYAVEQKQGQQGELTKQNFEAVERLKKEFPRVKIQATELADAIREVEKAGVKTVTNVVLGTDGLTQSLDVLDYYRQQALEISKGQLGLDKEINDLTTKKNALTDKLTEKTQIATRAEESATTKEKKWHNDKLTRALNEAKALDEGLAKETAVLRAEEAIALSKAKFEGKTAAERATIRLDFFDKIRKVEDDAVSEDVKAGMEKVKAYFNQEEEKEKKHRDTNEKLRELNREYAQESAEIDTLRAQAEAYIEVQKRVGAAKTKEERLRILREYEQQEGEIALRSLKKRRDTLNQELEGLREVGNLSLEIEAQLRNEILKTEKLILKQTADNSEKRTAAQIRDANIVAQKRRETLQLVAQTISSFDDPSIKSLAVMLTAWQQYEDVKNDISATAEEKRIAKIGFGIQSIGALSQAFFQAEAERFKRQDDQLTRRFEKEKKALADKNALEIASFRGTEEEKANLQRRLKAEESRLEEEYRRKRASIQLKQFLAEQRQKASQTLMAGALAGVQAYAQLGPIGGAIAAGGIGALTLLAVRQILTQEPPEFYNKGVEYVDKTGRHPVGVDTVPSMLTRGERVINAEDNKRLGGISNRVLLQNAVLGAQIGPAHLPAHQYLLEGLPELKPASMKPTERLLRDVSRKLDKLDKLDGLRQKSTRRGYNPDAATRHRSLFGN